MQYHGISAFLTIVIIIKVYRLVGNDNNGYARGLYFDNNDSSKFRDVTN